MSTATVPSPGSQLEDQLARAARDLAAAPLPGARDLPVLSGVNPSGGITGTIENKLVEVADLLRNSRRVFRHGDRIVFETAPGRDRSAGLSTLSESTTVTAAAADLLSNLFVLGHGENQYPVPRRLADLALRSELVLRALPEIRTYARRPVFDSEFVFRDPGWHPEAGILVHGPEVEPTPWVDQGPGKSVIDRLPPHLRQLLAGFCFTADADAANTVGLFVTGLLADHFASGGKPLAMLDGNQPGVGKTLLARVIGTVLDGAEPDLIRYSEDEEELQKRILAGLRSGSPSVIAIDNAKAPGRGEVSSPTLESITTSPHIRLRVLGTSTVFTRPNDVLWILTMNATRASTDLVSRGLAIRLAHEGDPARRTFGHDPIVFARAHRAEILGELAGMVMHWRGCGALPGTVKHRFSGWATTIGGVLNSCGVPEVLANHDEAASIFCSSSDRLGALAEALIRKKYELDQWLRPTDWGNLLTQTGTGPDKLGEELSDRSRAVRVGAFFAPMVDRPVRIEVDGRGGTAVLRSDIRRSRERVYRLAVEWDDQASGPSADPDQADRVTTERRLTDSAAGEAGPSAHNQEHW